MIRIVFLLSPRKIKCVYVYSKRRNKENKLLFVSRSKHEAIRIWILSLIYMSLMTSSISSLENKWNFLSLVATTDILKNWVSIWNIAPDLKQKIKKITRLTSILVEFSFSSMTCLRMVSACFVASFSVIVYYDFEKFILNFKISKVF